MAKIFAAMRLIAGALALAFVVAMAMPAAAQQPNSVNPNAAAVKEQQLLQQLHTIRGPRHHPGHEVLHARASGRPRLARIPQVTLKWIGGIVILGMLAMLIVFYSWHGTMRIEDGRSGRTIVRFNAFERFVHWLTATSFVILAITGLNITFGRSLILPWLGPAAFSDMVGMGEIRAQLSQLRLHHRRGADVPDVDRRATSRATTTSSGSRTAAACSAARSRRPRSSTAAKS